MRRALPIFVAILAGALLATLLPAIAGISGGGGGGITSNRYISGLRIQVTGDATISVTAGVAMDRGNAELLSNSATITSTAVFGAWVDGNDFGLDTGAEAASTWYHLHYIKDSTGAQGVLLSTSKAAPSMPAGATRRRWIGAVRNDASSNLLRGEYVGGGRTRQWIYQELEAATTGRILSNGSAATPTDVAVSTIAPPQALAVRLFAYDGAAGAMYVIHGGESANHMYLIGGAETELTVDLVPDANGVRYQKSSGSGAYYETSGYTIDLDGED